MKEIKIGGKIISQGTKPFIVVEVGVNYYDIAKKDGISPMEAAKLMISEAAKAGADAVKFQTYKAGKLASKHSPAYWDTTEETTTSQYELFKKFDKFEENEYKKLAEHCEEQNIIFMSTPFDEESADFLDNLMPVYKISSSDITNWPFIKKIAQKGKPIFLSTGASNINEIQDAVDIIKQSGNEEIVVMHCVLSYPTKFADANLNMLTDLRIKFPDLIVGYSDHTKADEDALVLISAYLLGARVIEKHFTLDKSLTGNDHYHAMDPSDLKKFAEKIGFIHGLLGEEEKKPVECESSARRYARRSIVAKTDILRGTVITRECVTFKRPGTGIPPKNLELIIGRRAKKDIEKDDIIREEDLI